MNEILAQEPAPWLLQDYLGRDQLAAIFGAPKTLKSFLALDWSLSIAYGLEWQGHLVSQGPVVYVYSEGGLSALKNRMMAWMSQHHVSETSDQFWAIPRSVRIPDQWPEMVREIREQCGAPVLVVIDTLARNFGGLDENSTRDMNQFIDGCGYIKAAFPGSTILIVHHTGHGAVARARGSSSLPAALDAHFLVERPDRDGALIELSTVFQKDSEGAPKMTLLADRIKLPKGETSLAFSFSNSTPRAIDIARDCLAAHPNGISEKALVEEIKSHGVAKATAYRAAKKVMDEQAATKQANGPTPARPVAKVVQRGPGGLAGGAAYIGSAVRDTFAGRLSGPAAQYAPAADDIPANAQQEDS